MTSAGFLPHVHCTANELAPAHYVKDLFTSDFHLTYVWLGFWNLKKKQLENLHRGVNPPEDCCIDWTTRPMTQSRIKHSGRTGSTFALLWASCAQLPLWLHTAPTSPTDIKTPYMVSSNQTYKHLTGAACWNHTHEQAPCSSEVLSAI